MLNNAEFEGILENPTIKSTALVPNRLISFSKSFNTQDFDQWILFYEDDYKFNFLRYCNQAECISYLKHLSKFNGVILPDFRVYRDLPLVMQLNNIFVSRVIGNRLQNNMINIRYGDARTYSISCYGIEHGETIAIGSHGTIKVKEDRKIFETGLEYVIKTIKPTTIVVYGSTPHTIFGNYESLGSNIVQFDSEFAIAHKAVQ